jgi:hypothetical protein
VRSFALVLYPILAACLWAETPSAFDLYERGRDSEKAGHMAAAYLEYSQAAALEPNNRTYWQHSQAVRFRAILEKGHGPGSAADAPQLMVDIPPLIPPATFQDRADARNSLPPVELKADPSLRDFDLRGDSKKLYQDVAQAYGLDCIFDNDYQPVGPVHFAVTGMNYREALYALQSATATFAVPMGPKMFLVAKDTLQKRIELEPAVAIAVPLPGAITVQDFNAAVVAVQQALALEKVSFDTQENTVIIRDRISKVLPARAMLEDLLHQRGQVIVDLRLMEVSRNNAIEYGVEFPSLFSLTPLTKIFNNSFSLSSSITGVLTFGGGKTLIGLGIMTPQMVATMSGGGGKVLFDSQIPTLEGQPASMHIGERYPVATSTFSSSSLTTGSSSTSSTTIPQFTYEDLGLIVKVTARLHGTEEVTLDVDAAFKLLTGGSNDGIPIVSNRAVKSNVRIAAGQWAVLGGLLDTNDAVTLSGLAGTSRIPFLSALTRTRTKTTSNDQVLILLRPRIISLPPDQFPTRAYRLGSESRPMIPL